MKDRTVGLSVWAFFGALCLIAPPASHTAETEVLILPHGVADNGNSGVQILTELAIRFQQVVRASEFAESMPEGAWITGISFRAGGGSRPGDTYSVSFLSTEVLLSTTAAQPGALSSMFNSNWGADARSVFTQQNYDWVMPVVDGTASFSPAINFELPFLYDPNGGNLLIDVVLRGPSQNTGIDLHGAFDDQSNGIGFTGFGAASPTPTTALNPNNFGMAPVRFEFQRVPEPGSSVLLVFGVGLLALKAIKFKGGA